MTPSQCRLAVAYGKPVLTSDIADTGGDAEAQDLLRAQCETIQAVRLSGDFSEALKLAITNSNPKENI